MENTIQSQENCDLNMFILNDLLSQFGFEPIVDIFVKNKVDEKTDTMYA